MTMYFNSAQSYEESVSQVTATNSVRLGDRRVVDGEEYVYCYNAGGGQCTTGNGVRIVTGASGYSVAATSLTDTVNPCVGVVKNATLTTGTYGWVMTKGYHTVVVVTALTADFTQLGLGVDGKFIVGAQVGTGNAAGFALNANTGAGGSVYAFIKTGF